MTTLYVALLGAIGGVANSLLLHGGWILPDRSVDDQNQAMLRAGFVGPLLLGALAALATYFLGGEKLGGDKGTTLVLGLALVSGVGGGNVLASLMQKQETSVLRTQMDALGKALQLALKVPPPSTPPNPAPPPDGDAGGSG